MHDEILGFFLPYDRCIVCVTKGRGRYCDEASQVERRREKSGGRLGSIGSTKGQGGRFKRRRKRKNRYG